MRSGVGFMFLAISSLLVARVLSSRACPEIVNSTEDGAYENALKNGINTFFKDLRGGIRDLDLRLDNTTVLDGSHKIDLDMWEDDPINLVLEDMTVSGFLDMTVLDVVVRPKGLNSRMDLLLDLKIPEITITTNYYLNGTWRGEEYDSFGFLESSSKNSISSIRLVMSLGEDREHWNLTAVSIRHHYVYNHDEDLRFRNSMPAAISEYAIKTITTVITSSINSILSHHFERITKRFLRKLFKQVRWYSIAMGEFDPNF